MKRIRPISVLLVCLALLSTGVIDAAAEKKDGSEAQTSFTFKNTEAVAAHGLHVILSRNAHVVTTGADGAAGPFRDIRGNGTSHIILANPQDPIPTGGDASAVTLTFRGQKKQIAVKKYWWVSALQKPLGKKHKV